MSTAITTSPTLVFFAAGTPAPQGSKRPVTNGGRTVLVEMSKGLPAWRRDVCRAVSADLFVESPIDVAVSVAATFVMPRPKLVEQVYAAADGTFVSKESIALAGIRAERARQEAGQ